MDVIILPFIHCLFILQKSEVKRLRKNAKCSHLRVKCISMSQKIHVFSWNILTNIYQYKNKDN